MGPGWLLGWSVGWLVGWLVVIGGVGVIARTKSLILFEQTQGDEVDDDYWRRNRSRDAAWREDPDIRAASLISARGRTSRQI